MTTDRHTITIYDPELFERLEACKGKYDSWEAVIDRLVTLAENNLIPHSRELKLSIGQDGKSAKKPKKARDEAAKELDKVFQEFWGWVKEQPATEFFKDYKLSVSDVQTLKAQVKKYGLEKMKNYHQAGINDPFLKENNIPLTFNNMFSNKAIARILATVHKTKLKTDFTKKKNQETLEYLRSLNK